MVYKLSRERRGSSKAKLKAAGIGAFFRLKDARAVGLEYRDIQRLVSEGAVERVGGRLYRIAEAAPNEHESIAMASSALPHAIVCLLTALRVHGIGTQSPPDVWLAIDRKARKPSRAPVQVRIVRFSGRMLTYGVIRMTMMGVAVPITSPARTVVDCFRYRRKVGMDVALEALRDSVRRRKAGVDEITRAAEVCRIRTVIAPYLETLSA